MTTQYEYRQDPANPAVLQVREQGEFRGRERQWRLHMDRGTPRAAGEALLLLTGQQDAETVVKP